MYARWLFERAQSGSINQSLSTTIRLLGRGNSKTQCIISLKSLKHVPLEWFEISVPIIPSRLPIERYSVCARCNRERGKSFSKDNFDISLTYPLESQGSWILEKKFDHPTPWDTSLVTLKASLCIFEACAEKSRYISLTCFFFYSTFEKLYFVFNK